MKYRIKELLKEGEGCIYSTKEIATLVGMDLSHETAPNVRNRIRQLIEEGCPIGSDTTGYYWIKTKDQLDATIGALQSRCDGIKSRIARIQEAYYSERNSRHLNIDLPLRVRCRAYVVYLAEETGIPYQAVWALVYRKFTQQTGMDTCNLPAHYRGSVLNYIINRGLGYRLYACLEVLEEALI